MEVDLVYYRRRSSAERTAAEAALDHKVRAIHLELMDHYEERIAALEAERRRAEMHLVSAA